MGGDPGVLAFVTNIAVELGNSIAEEVMPVFGKHGGYRVIYHVLIARFYSDANWERKAFGKVDESILEDFYEPFSLFYVSTAGYGIFGVRDFSERWGLRSTRQRVIEDRVIISELWYECFLLKNIPDYPCTDEFIRGFKEFQENEENRKTNKIPFRLVFAAQVNVDIHHAIGDYADGAVPILINRIKEMNEDLKEVCKCIKNIKSPHWSARDQKWLETTQEGFDWFLDDPFYKLRALHARATGNAREKRDILSKIDKWRILKRSPVLAGLVLYYHRAEMHEAGLKVTNAWGSIIPPAHLYNAIGQEGASGCLWEDMIHLLTIFGKEQFFVGGLPCHYSDYLERFMLQIGVSAAAFHTDRLLRGPLKVEDFTTKGARFLVSRALIHKSLQQRYHRNQNQMAWTTESISAILSSTEPEDKSRGKTQETETPKAEDTLFSPVGILRRLRGKMEKEVSELAWPYMAMHMINWKLLEDVRDLCEPHIRETYGGNWRLQEWELPFMCGHILSQAKDSEQRPESLLGLAGRVFDRLHQTDAITTCLRKMHQLVGIDASIPDRVMEICKVKKLDVERRTEERMVPQEPESGGNDLPPYVKEMSSLASRLRSLKGKFKDMPFDVARTHMKGFQKAVSSGDLDGAPLSH